MDAFKAVLWWDLLTNRIVYQWDKFLQTRVINFFKLVI